MNIDKVINTSLGLLEKLDSCINSLKECVKLNIVDNESREFALHRIRDLEQIAKVVSESFNPVDLSDNANLAGYVFKSKIYELGIASEIIRLRETGNTINAIAGQYNLSAATINRFLKHYDSMSQLTKAKIKASSVMNTTERLEDLMAMILRQLHRLEGVDDEVHVKYIGELRQTLGLAAQVSEKIATYKAYQQFRHSVQEILCSELPDRRLEIINKLKTLQESNTLNALPIAPAGR